MLIEIKDLSSSEIRGLTTLLIAIEDLSPEQQPVAMRFVATMGQLKDESWDLLFPAFEMLKEEENARWRGIAEYFSGDRPFAEVRSEIEAGFKASGDDPLSPFETLRMLRRLEEEEG